ncbi:hypothetical protein BDY19DRAFT_727773 [Irpex rosettiformis]|uniref:Uncharacterized protein n=1 Tax=Irpex rosettiformis TaxID=378272 RepID=A0ACB8U8N6_9APHY|nr:hypothetical protein BDY19DRAFT_727773 [Irpex rosettiformis]
MRIREYVIANSYVQPGLSDDPLDYVARYCQYFDWIIVTSFPAQALGSAAEPSLIIWKILSLYLWCQREPQIYTSMDYQSELLSMKLTSAPLSPLVGQFILSGNFWAVHTSCPHSLAVSFTRMSTPNPSPQSELILLICGLYPARRPQWC